VREDTEELGARKTHLDERRKDRSEVRPVLGDEGRESVADDEVVGEEPEHVEEAVSRVNVCASIRSFAREGEETKGREGGGDEPDVGSVS
jgi:hypothetical protein